MQVRGVEEQQAVEAGLAPQAGPRRVELVLDGDLLEVTVAGQRGTVAVRTGLRVDLPVTFDVRPVGGASLRAGRWAAISGPGPADR